MGLEIHLYGRACQWSFQSVQLRQRSRTQIDTSENKGPGSWGLERSGVWLSVDGKGFPRASCPGPSRLLGGLWEDRWVHAAEDGARGWAGLNEGSTFLRPQRADRLGAASCMPSVVQSLSRARVSAAPMDCSHQAPLSMGFSRPEYWSGLTFPPPGDLPNPEIQPRSPALASGFFTI